MYYLGKASILLLFIILISACEQSYIVEPTFMIKTRRIELNPRIKGPVEAINSFSYNSKLQKVFFSTMPVDNLRKSIFYFPFKDADTKNLLKFVSNLKISSSPSNSNRYIKSSEDGTYLAFISWNGSLKIYKNGRFFFDYEFPNEISSIDFADNLLAVGDIKGHIQFLDLGNRNILFNKKLIQGEIASITRFKNAQFFIAGDGDKIYLLDGITGKTIKSLEINSTLDKAINFSGISHCFKNRVNKTLYIPNHNLLATSQGSDYCKNRKIKLWETNSWKLVHATKTFKSPVHKMVMAKKSKEIIFVDYDENIFRLDLNNFKLSTPVNIHKSIYFFENLNNFKNKRLSRIPIGKINSIGFIPNTNILIMALGSYFKGGPGLLISKLENNLLKHLIYSEYYRGNFDVYVAKKEIGSLSNKSNSVNKNKL